MLQEQGEDALFANEAKVMGQTGGAAKDVHHMFTTMRKSLSNASTDGLKTAASIPKRRTASKTSAAPRSKRNTGFKGKKMPTGAKRQTKNAKPEWQTHGSDTSRRNRACTENKTENCDFKIVREIKETRC